MSPKFSVGDIVRLNSGWSPIRVTRTSAYNNYVYGVYCSQKSDGDEQSYSTHDIRKVIDPVNEFKRCSNWEDRLTPEDRCALANQLSKHAQPLPWLNSSQSTSATETTMTKLYQTKEDMPRFGIMLATNSAGKLVLEMKGSSEVLAFDKKEVEEVKPYTVSIKFQDSGTEYHYLSRKGDVQKDDLILVDGNGHMAKVTAVDTKSDRATKELKGRKVVTAEFGDHSVTEATAA